MFCQKQKQKSFMKIRLFFVSLLKYKCEYNECIFIVLKIKFFVKLNLVLTFNSFRSFIHLLTFRYTRCSTNASSTAFCHLLLDAVSCYKNIIIMSNPIIGLIKVKFFLMIIRYRYTHSFHSFFFWGFFMELFSISFLVKNLISLWQ